MVAERVIDDTPLAGPRPACQLVYLSPWRFENAAGPPGSNFGFSSQYGTFFRIRVMPRDPTYL